MRQRGKGSGVIDRDGRQVIGLVYDDLRYPKDGYLVARRKGAWGIIDARSGRAVVPLTHANLDDVAILDAAGTPVFAVRESSGLCLFARNGKRLACGVGLAEDAGSGLIAVFVPGPRGKYHGFWGALDAAGRQVIKVRYDTAPSFHDGLARVSRAGHAFYIDLHGREYVAADVLPLH